eukprot:COSAG01_NODE_19265_length_1020_cov_13.761129_1_plen_49_part_10
MSLLFTCQSTGLRRHYCHYMVLLMAVLIAVVTCCWATAAETSSGMASCL